LSENVLKRSAQSAVITKQVLIPTIVCLMRGIRLLCRQKRGPIAVSTDVGSKVGRQVR